MGEERKERCHVVADVERWECLAGERTWSDRNDVPVPGPADGGNVRTKQWSQGGYSPSCAYCGKPMIPILVEQLDDRIFAFACRCEKWRLLAEHLGAKVV